MKYVQTKGRRYCEMEWLCAWKRKKMCPFKTTNTVQLCQALFELQLTDLTFASNKSLEFDDFFSKACEVYGMLLIHTDILHIFQFTRLM